MEENQEDTDKKAAVWKQIKRILTRRQLCGKNQEDSDKKVAVWKKSRG